MFRSAALSRSGDRSSFVADRDCASAAEDTASGACAIATTGSGVFRPLRPGDLLAARELDALPPSLPRTRVGLGDLDVTRLLSAGAANDTDSVDDDVDVAPAAVAVALGVTAS